MKRGFLLLGSVSALLFLNVAAAVAAPAAVGRWNIVLGDGQPSGYCWIEILPDGDKFKAKFQPEAGGCHDIDPPKVDGDKVEFKAGWTYTGTVKDDVMTGERAEGNNKQKFTAKRWAPMLNVKGKWALKVEGSTENVALTLGEKNGKVAGGLTGDKKGKISDAVLKQGTLTFKVADADYKVVFKGDVLSGEVTAEGKTAKLTGTRERKYGEPIELFNGKNTEGWKPLGDPKDFKWEVKKEGNDAIMGPPRAGPISSASRSSAISNSTSSSAFPSMATAASTFAAGMKSRWPTLPTARPPAAAAGRSTSALFPPRTSARRRASGRLTT